MKQTIQLVEKWAEERNLIKGSTPIAQFSKTLEEVSELVRAVEVQDLKEIKDSIGDVMVTLIIIAKQTNVIKIPTCFSSALKHAGQNGTFDGDKRKCAHEHVSNILENCCDCYDKMTNGMIPDYIDFMVETLSVIARIYGFTLEECLKHAYNEIKDRKGRMVDGVFLKDE